MAEPSILISGASRGIGLEFARQFCEMGWHVIATCRNPEQAAELAKLSGVIIHRLDVTDPHSITALRTTLGRFPIDILLSNAGIIGQLGSVSTIDYKNWNDAMETNVFGAFRLVQSFGANVAVSARKQLVFVSSTAGSIAHAQSSDYVYRSSKAALNMAVRCLSLEVHERGMIVNLLCPGNVSTDMNPRGNLSSRESVAGMIRQIISFTPADNGRFLTYEGVEVPW
jgi:NAD(P)-dependent dehydrogenase (short-subunit alcohol dehydrogenase family)